MTSFDELMRRPGFLTYEGLITLVRDGQEVMLWGRLYESDQERTTDWSRFAILGAREGTLVVTSKRPDLPRGQQHRVPRPPFVPPRHDMLEAVTAEPWTVCIRGDAPGIIVEIGAHWYGSLDVHREMDGPDFWVADLLVTGPAAARRRGAGTATP